MTVTPDLKIRALYDEQLNIDGLEGFSVRRASDVRPIISGRYKHHWYVDMSHLGPEHRMCLWPPVTNRQTALDMEQLYIINNWVLPEV